MHRRSFLLSTASLLMTATGSPVFGQGAAPRMFPAADFVESVGVCVHLSNRKSLYGNAATVIPLLKEIGIVHVRDDAIFASYVNRDYDFYKRVHARSWRQAVGSTWFAQIRQRLSVHADAAASGRLRLV